MIQSKHYDYTFSEEKTNIIQPPYVYDKDTYIPAIEIERMSYVFRQHGDILVEYTYSHTTCVNMLMEASIVKRMSFIGRWRSSFILECTQVVG